MAGINFLLWENITEQEVCQNRFMIRHDMFEEDLVIRD